MGEPKAKGQSPGDPAMVRAILTGDRVLRVILDESPQIIFVTDRDGAYVFVNRTLANLYGLRPDDMIGKTVEDLHPRTEESGRYRENDRHVIDTGESLYIPETLVSLPDGRVCVMEMNIVPLELPGQAERLALGFGIDITELKRTERALYDGKERLLVTLRSMGEGVVATDIRGRVAMMNPMAQDITGWDEAEAMGRPVGDVFRVRYGIESVPVPDPVREILEERRIVMGTADTFLERRGGGLREITERGAPIISEDGSVFGAVLVFSDVSEKRAMERELEKIQKIEAIGVLAGGIAHDFNNILMAVLGNISLARLELQPSTEAYELLLEAEKAIQQAKRLTAQLSSMAKGGDEPQRTVVSVKGLIQDACPIALRGGGLECRYEIDDDVCDIHADPAQLAQVLQNLLMNAREAMPSGGVVTVRASNFMVEREHMLPLQSGPYVKLEVQDTGKGMPPETVKRIFDPYFTTKSRGSGLGLTVSFSVLKKHGGCITVRSRVGEGTTFTLYLPVYRGEKIAEVSSSK